MSNECYYLKKVELEKEIIDMKSISLNRDEMSVVVWFILYLENWYFASFLCFNSIMSVLLHDDDLRWAFLKNI